MLCCRQHKNLICCEAVFQVIKNEWVSLVWLHLVEKHTQCVRFCSWDPSGSILMYIKLGGLGDCKTWAVHPVLWSIWRWVTKEWITDTDNFEKRLQKWKHFLMLSRSISRLSVTILGLLLVWDLPASAAFWKLHVELNWDFLTLLLFFYCFQ